MSVEVVQQRLSDRFDAIRPLAQGGMGILFSAIQRTSQQPVAIKVLTSSLTGEAPPELKARFLREAAAIARLSHPFIVRVLEVGDRAEMPYFVMEMAQGDTLSAWLARQTRPDVPKNLRIALDICDGLMHAHQKGIVHRDLKPGNVMVLPQGGVKILDFGLAKLEDESSCLTRTGQIMGTPSYMAPEQLLGEVVDGRADVYALGVILYELLTLALPFPGDMFYLKTQRVPEPPSSKNPDVSVALDGVVGKALAIDPGARHESIQELKWELSACLKDYVALADVPLLGQDWRALLQSDLERLASSTAPAREHVSLREGMVRDVVLVDVRLTGAIASEGALQKEGIGFVRDRMLYILTQELAKWGGMLDRYEPDGLVSFFGSQSTSEQDGQRAIRAGLAILQRAAEVDGMLRPRGLGFDTSVAVDVARLSVDTDEGVDEAAFDLRRSQRARPPGVWVTAPVAARVGGDFVLGAETGDGLVRVERAAPARASGPGTSGMQLAAFVGRTRELGELAALEAQAAKGPTVALVRGEAGIGKTRFAGEFLRSAQPPVVRGAAVAFPRAPYRLALSLVSSLLGVREGAPPAQIAAELGVKLDALNARGALEAPLGHLLGLPGATRAFEGQPPSVVRDAVTEAVSHLLAGKARWTLEQEKRPLVLVCEDVHVIDELSLQMLEAFLFSNHTPVLVILTARPPWELPERWRRAAHGATIDLGPLDPVQAHALVRSLAPPGSKVAAVEERVLALSGGNPLFLEETVHMLEGTVDPSSILGSGVIKREGRITKKVRALDPSSRLDWIPCSIQALVASRVDALAQAERETLQMCAILGAQIDGAVLEEMAAEFWGETKKLGAALEQLSVQRFLEAQHDRDGSSYRFRQSLVREVVYGTMLACNRRVLHELAASAVEKLARGTGEDASELLAYHLGRAARWERAVEHAQRALGASVARYDHEATLRLASEALQLIQAGQAEARGDAPRPHRKIFDVLAMRESAHDVLGLREKQRADLEALVHIGRQLDDDQRVGRALVRMARFHCWHLGDQIAAQKVALEAVERAMKGKDAGLEADALTTLAASHGLLGNWAEANRFYRRGQRLFERLGQTGGVAAALCYQAIHCGSHGPLAPAFEMASQALALDREREDRRAIGRDLRTLGSLHAGVGDTEKALACFDEALGGDRQIGYLQGLAYDLAYTAPALIETGRAAEALVRLEEALELARASHLRYLYGEALVGLAQAHLEAGGPGAVDHASARAEEAGQLGADMGLLGLEVTALAALARATLEAGDARAAHALSERAVGFLRGGPMPTVRAWEIWWHHARILAALGRAEEAVAARDQARALVEARAAELGDPALAESFKTRVRVNRRILGLQT